MQKFGEAGAETEQRKVNTGGSGCGGGGGQRLCCALTSNTPDPAVTTYALPVRYLVFSRKG